MTVKRLDTVYPNQKEDIERELAKNESDITQSQGKKHSRSEMWNGYITNTIRDIKKWIDKYSKIKWERTEINN